MEINIFESLKNTIGSMIIVEYMRKKVWDSYSGPYFSKENSLCLLNYHHNIIILHFIQLSSREI